MNVPASIRDVSSTSPTSVASREVSFAISERKASRWSGVSSRQRACSVRADLLDAANRCARALSSSLELEPAFTSFVRELQGVVPFDRAALILADAGAMRVMAAAGVLAGAAFGFVMARLAHSYFLDMKMPGALPVVLSAFVLLTAAVVASSVPAARAARIDVMAALRAE